MEVVRLQGLSKSFPNNGAEPRWAVRELDLELKKGEVIGLLGPNGAGKTTVIHMLLGLLRPTAGSVRIFGLDMPADRQRILQRVAFSSAYVQLPFSLTARENLQVFARMYGVAHPNKKAAELLERMEIAELADAPTRALSSGQVSRLNLAKALLNDPELLLLDEPTASMDPDIAAKTRSILKEIQRERGLTVVYTSHNMREVEQLATRVVFLQRGRVAAQGTREELLQRYGETDLESVFMRIARQ
jgi:ABC-2 type transport system ATP-binding protein